MFIPTTNYWNVINGTTPDEVFEDEEGMQIMRVLGNNMAFLASFLQYFIKFVVFVILAVAGVFAGKKWRMSKDAKSEANEK